MAQLIKRNMRLLGLPYQFLDSVDPRIDSISTIIGRKFAENIVLDAPVVTIIPGRPKYLPGTSDEDKQTMTQAFFSASNDNFSSLKEKLSEAKKDNKDIRYYDFERDYTEYMTYVNVLCRTCASFLEITETIDGKPCQSYDYRNYKWNTSAATGGTFIDRAASSAASRIKNSVSNIYNGIVNLCYSDTNTTKTKNTKMVYETTGTTGENDNTIDDLLTNYNFVQFFVDAEGSSESISNSSTESKLKGLLDSVSNDIFKELAFAMDSAGLKELSQSVGDFANNSTDALSSVVGGFSTGSGVIDGLTTAVSRVMSLSGNVVKGENVIMPNIYQSSSYSKSYSFTVHLKSPYGTKFGYFMDICVPLMHLLALGLPKQTSANTYGAPFLVKAYCDGIFNCNLGMVESISITKGVNNAYSVDGLPTEIDVNVQIVDLYSDLSMSPQSDAVLFLKNSSLIEYLATTCGLSLVTPQISKKVDMIISTVKSSFTDVPTNVMSTVTEKIDNIAASFFGLYL